MNNTKFNKYSDLTHRKKLEPTINSSQPRNLRLANPSMTSSVSYY